MSDSTKIAYLDSNNEIKVIESSEDGNALPVVAV